jgi:hypothetical protein
MGVDTTPPPHARAARAGPNTAATVISKTSVNFMTRLYRGQRR